MESGRNRNHTLRYIAIVAIFCAVCVVYLGRLFYMQISGRENTYDAGTTTRRVTIQAVRGELYDRNGVKLVENRYTYDLVLSSTVFSELSTGTKNDALLRLSKALRECGSDALHTEPYFPMEGQYPYYSYLQKAQNSDTVIGYRKSQVLSRLRLDENASAEDLMKYYVKTYGLLAIGSDGVRLYDDNQIDALIRLYYDMDAKNFRANGEYIFASDISFDQEISRNLLTYVKEQSIPSVTLKGQIERVYLYPGIASHILGSVGPIYLEEWEYYDAQGYPMNAIVGKDGCEAAFESYLHGIDGELEIVEDANGTVLNVTTIREPVAGYDVRLTIDLHLQIATEKGLSDNVAYVSGRTEYASEGRDCQAGAAVAMDPDTFEVLAIASYPTYDLVTFNENYAFLRDDPLEPLRNRALNEGYAPGSTLKLGVAAIALMEGKVKASDAIPCNGKYQNAVGCSTYEETHRNNNGLNVFDAITHSCNSYFCELGNRLGIAVMEHYLSRMGLGQSTGLELGGAKGILAGPTYRAEISGEDYALEWNVGMTWQASIGQSDHRMTPIQLAAYTGTLANGGKRYETRLLHSVYRFGASEPIEIGSSELLDDLQIPEGVEETLWKSMKQMVSDSDVVTRNLGLSALPDGVTVGGKTGTAETGGDADNALFVCHAESAELGDVVISVVLEKGAHGYHAARTAGSVLAAFYGTAQG